MMTTPFAFQIFQEPDRVLFVFEGGTHIWRVIYMDGRQHPKDPNPTFLGDSIGHWEGDTLVTDVVGFNDETWIDASGHPHSDVLHVTERYTRTDENRLHYEPTIDDRKHIPSRGARVLISLGGKAGNRMNTSARRIIKTLRKGI